MSTHIDLNKNNKLSYDVITKVLPNKRCILNNYIDIPLEVKNVGKRYVQLKLKKYSDWFSVSINCVLFL